MSYLLSFFKLEMHDKNLEGLNEGKEIYDGGGGKRRKNLRGGVKNEKLKYIYKEFANGNKTL